MFFLSIDVANKSLAISFLKYNNYNNSLKIKESNIKLNYLDNIKHLNKLNQSLNNIIQYYICEVIDLIPNKKVKNTTILERSNALKLYLQALKEKINNYIINLNIDKIILLI